MAGQKFNIDVVVNGLEQVKKLNTSILGVSKSLLKVVSVTALVAGTLDLVASSYKLFLDSQRSMRKLQQVLVNTGNAAVFSALQLDNMAGRLSVKIGQDDLLIKDNLITPLLTFSNISKPIFESAINSAADLAAIFGSGDLLGKGIIKLGKLLQDPMRNMNALNKMGIQFSLILKLKITNLQKSGKLLLAQKFILDRIDKVAKSAALANATPLLRLTVATNEFKKSIGSLLSVVGPDFITFLTKAANAAQLLLLKLVGVAATNNTIAIQQLRKSKDILDTKTKLKYLKQMSLFIKNGAVGGRTGLVWIDLNLHNTYLDRLDLLNKDKKVQLQINSLVEGLRQDQVKSANAVTKGLGDTGGNDDDKSEKVKFVLDETTIAYFKMRLELAKQALLRALLNNYIYDTIAAYKELEVVDPLGDLSAIEQINANTLNWKSWAETALSIANTVSDSFGQLSDNIMGALLNGLNFGKTMANVWKNMVTQIGSVILQMLILKSLMSILNFIPGGNIISNLFTGVTAWGMSAGSGNGTNTFNQPIVGVYNASNNSAIVNKLNEVVDAVNNIQTTYIDAPGIAKMNKQGKLQLNTTGAF